MNLVELELDETLADFEVQDWIDNVFSVQYPDVRARIKKGCSGLCHKKDEWHYPSKGELPKDLCLVIACFWELGKKQVREVYFDSKYFCYHGKHIEPVAWQYYPVPPKEDK